MKIKEGDIILEYYYDHTNIFYIINHFLYPKQKMLYYINKPEYNDEQTVSEVTTIKINKLLKNKSIFKIFHWEK